MNRNVLDLVDEVNKQDVLIVLGGENPQRRPRSTLAYVLFNLVRGNRDPLSLVLTGRGSGFARKLPEVPESEQMKQFLEDAGIPEDHLHTEAFSLDTLANFVYAQPILYGLCATRVGVVTDPHHMGRALWTAEYVLGRRIKCVAFPTNAQVSLQTRVVEWAIRIAHLLDKYVAREGIASGDHESAIRYLAHHHPYHAPLAGNIPSLSAHGVGVAVMRYLGK